LELLALACGVDDAGPRLRDEPAVEARVVDVGVGKPIRRAAVVPAGSIVTSSPPTRSSRSRHASSSSVAHTSCAVPSRLLSSSIRARIRSAATTMTIAATSATTRVTAER
jgi:hypothetical protein